MDKKQKEKKRIAFLEIVLLLVGTFAFVYFVGMEFKVVSAQEPAGSCIQIGGRILQKDPATGFFTGEGVRGYLSEGQICDPAGYGNEITCTNSHTKIAPSEYISCPPQPSPTSQMPSPTQGLISSTGQIVASNYLSQRVLGPVDESDLTGNEAGDVTGTQGIAEEAGGKTRGFLSKLLFAKKAEALSSWVYILAVPVTISIITFVSVWAKTGDTARAAEVAVRVGVGAGVGAAAGYLAAGVVGGPVGLIVAAGVVGGIWLSSLLKREQDRSIDFQCKPWQAEAGVEKQACSLCNEGPFPCTEYQCRSFGANCELINKNTDDPRCVLKDEQDIESYYIVPWREVLEEGYNYEPLPRGQYGASIVHEETKDGCLPAFQPFTLGIGVFKSDSEREPKEAYCKVDFERTSNFADMRFDFGGRNTYHTQHTQTITFPGVAHLEQAGLEVDNDKEFELYVRCESVNKISNREEFLFSFCTEKGPDTTPPVIKGFDPEDNTAVAYFSEDEARELDVKTYTNEPSECRWDYEDINYENMENLMDCPSGASGFNSGISYTCSGTLTGLKNREKNEFFFRCNDTFGNVNAQSKKLNIIGTQPLHISEARPDNVTIKDSTDSIKITLEAETNAGIDEGAAVCSFSSTGETKDYIVFSKTNSFKHSNNLWLTSGDYTYFIRCRDSANNADTTQVSFTVESDTQAPITVRVYKEENYLKVITDEPASCVYSNFDCNYLFEDGIEMDNLGTGTSKEHFTEWNPNHNFYIKCQDEFGNRPAPNQCNIIVRPFEL